MTPAGYALHDDQGNGGQKISLTQGESRTISVYLFEPDGSPVIYTATLTELLVKIYTSVSLASIQKKFSTSQVTPLYLRPGATGTNTGIIGFQFQLAAADTAQIAANNPGVPMTATFTDSGGNVLEYDFLAAFSATLPVVQS